MRLVCPSCGACHSADAFVNDAYTRQALSIIATLPRDMAGHALPYVALFRNPAGQRGLSWKRAVKLLTEIRDMVGSGHVQYKRNPARPATPKMWGDAMGTMVGRSGTLDLPMANHIYLAKIVWDAADSADAQAEYARNRAERSGALVKARSKSEPEQAFGGMTAEEMKAMRERNMKK